MKNIILALMVAGASASCVSTKVYSELADKYSKLKTENQGLYDNRDLLQKELGENGEAIKKLKSDYEATSSAKNKLEKDIAALQNNLSNLQTAYDALEKNSSVAMAENLQKNRDLLAQLEAKENALAQERSRLETLENELAQRAGRVDELERLIAQKEASLQKLKDAVSKALLGFEGNGLTVEQKNGKIYVSLENRLLFESGSWAIGSRGRQAVEALGKVLADNQDIAILIEGHTDNVPYRGGGDINDNWDLSTKRSTAVVSILQENKGVKLKNITAAGRGEFAPIASNETADGKQKNRRIEVILTPNLDQISALLNEN
ncbi:MAG: cell envelope biogenesis protein OmpA [Flavobacteriales bacterium CG_4_9_14_3_um_filter_40_17]|nr:MAG: cell envelope biogenesis protein OmpA [Flavobacteriales bacterium CG_4_9_14_3_um_filter_40_17]